MLQIFSKQMVVPADTSYLPTMRQFISQIGEKYNFTKHEINAFRISIDEAATNIIEHGYTNNIGSITMKVRGNRNKLVVELIDQGQSFDPGVIKDPNILSYVETQKKGGLGIFIMRKFLDSIEYEVTNMGNVLRLIKNRENGHSRPFIVPLTTAFKRIKKRLFPSLAN